MDRKDRTHFYITTTLPYVNADPHIGHATEFVRADIIARHKRILGKEVFFNTGTDEHGIKIYRKAEEAGIPPQEYVDIYAKKFAHLKPLLNLSYTNFIRTTEIHHIQAAQEFWKLCENKGDIYKKNYQIKYCVGCELEKTDSELVEGKCPIHPNLEIELISEENYFFRFSKYQEPLLKLYAENPDLVIPGHRFNEIKAFVERGLEDFSISRLASKMPWGVPVPGDSEHVMYVWFDALVNYISAIGWPEHGENFKKWWPVVQYAGKDNLRQQTAMWQAMLLSADLPSSESIVINGFVNSGGQKMSKSLGNVVYPQDIVEEYGTDALRYYIAREMSPFEDSDYTHEKFKEAYNANLANGLGNLVSRVVKMAATNEVLMNKESAEMRMKESTSLIVFRERLEEYKISEALDEIWRLIQQTDKFIQIKQPFKLVKTEPEKAKQDILFLAEEVYIIGKMLEPIMPHTSAKVQEIMLENLIPEKPLFPRKD